MSAARVVSGVVVRHLQYVKYEFEGANKILIVSALRRVFSC